MINLQKLTGTTAGINAALTANTTGTDAEKTLLAANTAQINAAMTAALADGKHNGIVVSVVISIPTPNSQRLAISCDAIQLLN